MKTKTILTVFLLLFSISVFSQSFDFQFDHQSLVVTKLQETGDFYNKILGLEEIPHPEKDPRFRWFKIHNKAQLHLIGKKSIVFKKDKSIHLCLATQNLKQFIAHLKENHVDFYDWPGKKNTITNRKDGVKQIYIQDPEGYWIEINDVKH